MGFYQNAMAQKAAAIQGLGGAIAGGLKGISSIDPEEIKKKANEHAKASKDFQAKQKAESKPVAPAIMPGQQSSPLQEANNNIDEIIEKYSKEKKDGKK